MPLREVDGRLHGPGIFDMKSGIAVSMLAMRALAEIDAGHGRFQEAIVRYDRLARRERVGIDRALRDRTVPHRRAHVLHRLAGGADDGLDHAVRDV